MNDSQIWTQRSGSRDRISNYLVRCPSQGVCQGAVLPVHCFKTLGDGIWDVKMFFVCCKINEMFLIHF